MCDLQVWGIVFICPRCCLFEIASLSRVRLLARKFNEPSLSLMSRACDECGGVPSLLLFHGNLFSSDGHGKVVQLVTRGVTSPRKVEPPNTKTAGARRYKCGADHRVSVPNSLSPLYTCDLFTPSCARISSQLHIWKEAQATNLRSEHQISLAAVLQ